jgi:hypothetical protein
MLQRRLHTAAACLEHPPVCVACQYGQQHRCPMPGRHTTIVRDRVGVLVKTISILDNIYQSTIFYAPQKVASCLAAQPYPEYGHWLITL